MAFFNTCSRKAKLWNLEGAKLHSFQRHTDIINLVTLSPNGQKIIAISSQGIISSGKIGQYLAPWRFLVENL